MKGAIMTREAMVNLIVDFLDDLPGAAQMVPSPEADAVNDESDMCGFCGQPGTDKLPHPLRWPGEQSAGTECVHA